MEKKEKSCCDNCYHFSERGESGGYCRMTCASVKKAFVCENYSGADFDEYMENHLSAVVQSHDFD